MTRGLRASARRMALVSSIAGLLVVTACAGSAGENETLHIVATTSIWGDVISQITGDEAEVEVLIPRGADAHEYEPSPQQLAALQRADLVVANGLGLEAGLADLLQSAAADGANIFELAPELDPLPFAEHETHGHEPGEPDEEDDHEHGELDPHVWFDLTRVDTAIGLLAARLAELDDTVDWAERARDYSENLLQTDEEVRRILDSVPAENKKLVTNHEAIGYLADRYDLEIVGVVIPGGSTLGDPSSAEIAALVEEMIEEGVTAIFAETSQPARLAETVAAEVGEEVSVVELYTESLGEPGSGVETLIDIILTDARLIADALSG